MRKTVDPLRLFKPRLALFLTCILQVILPTAPQKIISTSDDSRPADNEGNYNMYFLQKNMYKLCCYFESYLSHIRSIRDQHYLKPG